MTDFTDLSALDRLDRDLADLRAHQQFIVGALARRGAQSKQAPAPSGQAEPPRAQQEGIGEGANRSPSSTKSLPARGPMTEHVGGSQVAPQGSPGGRNPSAGDANNVR
jgi:hypothetical protein